MRTRMTIACWSTARLMALLAAVSLCAPLAAARAGELVRLDERLVPALLALSPEESVAVADWPVAPGVRRAVSLARHEVWADGAKVFRADASGRTELPRSSLRFFWGSDTEGGGSRVLVTVDPLTRELA